MTDTSKGRAARALSDRDRALEAQARFAFLARSSQILSESLDYEETLTTVAAMALPHLGGWCIVDVVEDGVLRRLAVIHPDPTKQALARELGERYPPEADDVLGVKRVIESGRSEIVTEISSEHLRQSARDPEHLRLMRALGIGSYITVPLLARGSTSGTMTFVTGEDDRHFGETDLLMAEDLGRRCAITIDNARLFRALDGAWLQASEAVRQRDQVLAVVSHDLRNPIHAIQIQTAVLLGKNVDLSEKSEDAIRAIQRTSHRMERLVQDLLDAQRLDAGHALAIDLRPTRIAGLLDDACALLVPQAESKNIRLECAVPDISSSVLADPERLLQVIWNLLGNAIKFTPEGGSVEIGCEAADEAMRFWVRDTGPGIPPEELPRLFDPYWQARRVARLGTGLGLTISKALVEAHGGRIDVQSAEGEGTVFRFTIPTAGAAASTGEESRQIGGAVETANGPN
jgi:signal transduction histidine kinase